MIQLIADSGSTKTQWVLTNGSDILIETFTKGINPFFQDATSIAEEIKNGLIPMIDKNIPDKILFYGAGCAFPDKKKIVADGIQSNFTASQIFVESDLLGAARALLQHNEGIACILGTGSNSCYYDGKEIVQNVSPLGFILGDEGSGAVLGKTLVADILKNQLPDEIKTRFSEQYKMGAADILDKVYKQPFPNRFLASFAPFLSENIDHPDIRKMVLKNFEAFFVRNVLQYKKPLLTVSFTGSVAVHFNSVLVEAAENLDLQIGKIEQSPLPGLIQYHCQQ